MPALASTMARAALLGGVSRQQLSLNDRIVFAGDSITAHGFAGSSSFAGYGNWGYSTWVQGLTGNRLYSPPAGNQGVGGDTTAGLLARMATVMAQNPKCLVIQIGTNDCGSNVSSSTAIANITSIIAAASTASYIVLLTIMPRFSPSALTGPQETVRQAINSFIRSQASRRIIVADLEAPTNSSALFVDGLHPNSTGAYVMGQTIAVAMASIVPTADPFTGWTNTLAANPTMTGTGGFVNGGASGAVANGLSLDAAQSGGVTVVGSKGTLSNGNTAQIITLSGAYSGAGKNVNINFNGSTSLAAGDIPEYISEVEVSGLQNVLAIGTFLWYYGPGFTPTISQTQTMYAGDQVLYPASAGIITLRTPPLVIPSTPSVHITGILITLADQASSAPIAGQIKIGRNYGRKVPSGT